MQLGELGDWKSPSVVQEQQLRRGRRFRGSSSPQAEEVWGAEVTPLTVSHRLLIQCRISCGQSDLTQAEIHMAGLFFFWGGEAKLQFERLDPPSPWLATSLATCKMNKRYITAEAYLQHK